MGKILRNRAVMAAFGMTLFLLIGWFVEEHHQVAIPHDGEAPMLYTNQDGLDLRTLYKGAIDSAQKSVVLIIYSLNDQTIIDALNRKAKSGIPVTLVCDIDASAKAFHRLAPQVNVYKRETHGIMHLKILVIDENYTWIGSANMTGESLRMHGNLVAAIPSPSVAKTVLDKLQGLVHPEMNQGFPHQVFVIGGQKFELWFLPDDPLAVKRIVEIIRSAKKTVRVAMFTWTRFDLADEIIAAHRRGIDTQVVIDQNSGQSAGRDVVNRLVNGQVPVFLSEGNALLHYKMLCVDDETLVNGSANWTRAAFTKNDDCFFVLHDMNAEQQTVVNSVWNGAIKLAQEQYEHAR